MLMLRLLKLLVVIGMLLILLLLLLMGLLMVLRWVRMVGLVVALRLGSSGELMLDGCRDGDAVVVLVVEPLVGREGPIAGQGVGSL